MGCSKSKSVTDDGTALESRLNSQKIDREIERDRQISQRGNNVKVLLLGAGEGGKSTILKQMKILHIQGFGEDEILQYRSIIFSYLVENMKSILESLPEQNLTLPQNLESEEAQITSFLDIPKSSLDLQVLEESIGDALRRLWACEEVQRCITSPNHHQLDDSVPYFFNSMDRILSPSYRPTQADMIRVRVRTTGIVEVNFTVTEKNKTLNFKMFDVAGQRSERRKWIHCFEGVTAILFVVSLAEYDQMLMEDRTFNRMVESLNLFEAIVNNKFFTKSSFILFLNKKDIFESKIKHSRFSDFIPEYEGANEDNEIKEWIKKKYLEKNKVLENSGKLKKIFTHFTNATDTENIRHVFESVSTIIIEKLLVQEGLG